MRRAFLLLVCACLLPAQEPESRSGEEPTPEAKREKRIAALIQEVESLAGAEPPQIAIDSLIRAAKTVRPRGREKSLAFLQTAKERLAGFHSESARASFASQLGQYWSELDPVGSEEVCQSIPRGVAEEFESDPKSACWATRITRETKPAARAEASMRALADGAYSTAQHATTFTQLQKADPEAAAAFFSSYLAGFPEKSAGLPELKGLVLLLRAAGGDQPALSRQALELALRSIERKEFPEPKRPLQFEARIDGRTIRTSGARDSLAFQLADLAWMIAPDLLESHSNSLGKWKQEVSSGDWQRRRITRFREVEPGFDASLMETFGVGPVDPSVMEVSSFESAKPVLASTNRPEVRLLVLTQLLVEGKLSAKERAAAVGDIKSTLETVPVRNRLRIMVLFFLIDDALRTNELQSLQDYGGQLAAGFDATLGCPDAECEVAAAALSGGELASDFVDYLRRSDLEPAALGMTHPSLTLRMRLLEIRSILEDAGSKGKTKASAP